MDESTMDESEYDDQPRSESDSESDHESDDQPNDDELARLRRCEMLLDKLIAQEFPKSLQSEVTPVSIQTSGSKVPPAVDQLIDMSGLQTLPLRRQSRMKPLSSSVTSGATDFKLAQCSATSEQRPRILSSVALTSSNQPSLSDVLQSRLSSTQVTPGSVGHTWLQHLLSLSVPRQQPSTHPTPLSTQLPLMPSPAATSIGPLPKSSPIIRSSKHQEVVSKAGKEKKYPSASSQDSLTTSNVLTVPSSSMPITQPILEPQSSRSRAEGTGLKKAACSSCVTSAKRVKYAQPVTLKPTLSLQ